MSNADELLKLKELLDKNIITKEEFEIKKKELLFVNNEVNHINENNKDSQNEVNKKTKSKFKNIAIIFIIVIVFYIIGSSINLALKIEEQNKEEQKQLIEQYVSSYEDFVTIIGQCGFEQYSIERDDMIDNIEGEGTIGFRIKTQNTSIPMVFVKDGSIYCVKYDADRYLYKDGTIQHTLSEYITTLEERQNLIRITKETIQNILKSPSTAKFPSNDEWRVGKQDGSTIVQGYVDSQNGFGATVRSEFQVIYTNGIVTSLIFDGQEYIK